MKFDGTPTPAASRYVQIVLPSGASFLILAVRVLAPIPVPICADVIVRDLIGEHVVGVLRVAADDVGHMTVDREIVARLAPIDGLVDVILRPDPAAARRRFGTARIWGEPIVIEGVVVVRE